MGVWAPIWRFDLQFWAQLSLASLTFQLAWMSVDWCLPWTSDHGLLMDEIGQVARWMEEHMVFLWTEPAQDNN